MSAVVRVVTNRPLPSGVGRGDSYTYLLIAPPGEDAESLERMVAAGVTITGRRFRLGDAVPAEELGLPSDPVYGDRVRLIRSEWPWRVHPDSVERVEPWSEYRVARCEDPDDLPVVGDLELLTGAVAADELVCVYLNRRREKFAANGRRRTGESKYTRIYFVAYDARLRSVDALGAALREGQRVPGLKVQVRTPTALGPGSRERIAVVESDFVVDGRSVRRVTPLSGRITQVRARYPS